MYSIDKIKSALTCLSLAAIVTFIVTGCGSGSSEQGADPGILEVPVAFIKKPIPTDNQGQAIQLDFRDPRFFTEGGDVFLRDNSSAVAQETNITSAVTQGMGDVKGLNVSFDGKRIIFSLRLFDPNPNDDDTPTWNIYEYDVEQKLLRRLIVSDLAAEEGDDLYPAYLPDNRIVFVSSRQRQSAEVLSNEGKPRFSALVENGNTIAMVLHVMNSDGTEIHQISFNQSNDYSPLVLSNRFNGQVLFSRWDKAVNNNEVNLYKTNPDGSDLELLYGAHSHDTGTNNSTIQYTSAREMLDGNIMVITQPFRGTFGGGNIAIIDTDSFVDNDRPLWSLNGLPGPAESTVTINEITNDGSISRNGRYASAFPLWDGTNRILVSKSTCQIDVNGVIRPCIEPWISDTAAVEVSPAYGIWVYDADNLTEKVVVQAESNRVMTDIVALQSRLLPNVIFDKGPGDLNVIWRDDEVGVVNIKNVYDFGSDTFNGCFFGECTSAPGINTVGDLGDPAKTAADQRPARFVRFVKAVSLPDEDDPTLLDPPDLARAAFGPNRNLGMREILGYAPVAPDGSVKVKVPSNVPLAVEVLDKFGRRIGSRHDNWFQIRPGDSVTCVGCHSHNTSNNDVPFAHHRSDAIAPSINAGLPSSLVFANTQIPGTTDAYWGNLGQTMAEVRFDRVANTLPTATPEPGLSIDLRFDDVWTDPAVRAIDASFEFLYANLPTSVPSPATTNCAPWNSKCRSVIDYEQNIHPIWQVDRGAGVTCIECHTNEDAMAAPKVPDGQLDLTDGISDNNADRLKSYQELFFADAGEVLDMMGLLVNIQIEVPVLDANGQPVLDSMGNPVTEFIDDPNAQFFGTMSANGARSSYFIEKMTETELEAGRILSTAVSDPNYIDHSSFLSDDELRLISEWLDIGGQYFNDAFDPTAPQN